MSATAFHGASISNAAGPKAAISSRSNKQKAGLAKCGSSDLADHPNVVLPKSAAPQKSLPPTRPHCKKLVSGAENGRPISRVELLLAPKTSQPVFQPPEESSRTAEVNKSIKLAGQWTDVQKVVETAEELSASNIAFAVYRLGCLFTFTSNFRQQEILHSGLVGNLLDKGHQKLHQMDAGSVTLILDGCARLGMKPEENMQTALANLVYTHALTFEASQLPLVLWAFDCLKFIPRGNVLSALDSAVDRLAPAMSPQGLALTLRGFQAASHKPSLRTLARTAEALQRRLTQYKPSEIAACLDAFAAFGYTPPNQLLLAIAQQSGQSVHSNVVMGKPRLSPQGSENLEDAKLSEKASAYSEGRGRAPTATDRILRHAL